MNKYLGAYEFIKLCVRSWEHSTDELDRPVMNTQKQDNMNILKELVDKETPKKPDYEGDGYDDNGQMIYDTWICPNCGKRYEVDYDDYDYCPNCGQRLKWGEEYD